MSQSEPSLDPGAYEGVLDYMLTRAMALGADAADAGVSESRALDAVVRNRALEDVERTETRDLGLRVFFGSKEAGVSSSDLSRDGVDALIERVCAMAKASPEDPYAGLAPQDRLANDWPDLDLFDDTAAEPDALEARALAVEEAALDVTGVKQSDHAWAGWSASALALATSHGFAGQARGSFWSMGVAAIGEANGAMERDYEADSARHDAGLRDPAEIGRIAGERAVARLGASKIDSGKMPVLFENRVAGALLRAFAGAISGPGVARGVSFLKDKRGARVFAEGVNVIDDPLIPRGKGSQPFDGEGVATTRRAFIDDGVLTGWLLNSAAARQLGLETTGNASASMGGAPGVRTSNLWIEAGEKAPQALMAEMGEGLQVCEMFGPSLNQNTGDWSVGVSGFEIRNGERAGPVSEITVAGNLIDIFAALIPASDLEMRDRVNAPSLLVPTLSVAGR